MSDRATRDTQHRTAPDDRERQAENRADQHTPVAAEEHEANNAESMDASEAGVHPIFFQTGIAASLWFIAVVWLAFSAGTETDYLLVIVTLFL